MFRNFQDASPVLSEGDKATTREILSSSNAVEYMSSEECDPGDTTEERSRGPKPRKIRKLSWERSKVKNIKEILDECYLSGLNAKQRNRMAFCMRMRCWCGGNFQGVCPSFILALLISVFFTIFHMEAPENTQEFFSIAFL